MGGVGNRRHLRIGEMRAQPAPLLAEHPAGRGDLDHIGTALRCAADLLRTLDRPGAGERIGKQVEDFGAEAGDVAMAADDRQRRTGSDDARAGDQPFGRPAPQREGGRFAAARLAHGGEPGQRGDPRVLGADDGRVFFGVDGALTVVAPRIASQVDMQVDQAGQHGLVGKVDHADLAGRRVVPFLDRDDPAVADRDRGRAARFAFRIGQHRSGVDHRYLRQRGPGSGHGQQGHTSRDHRKQATHRLSPLAATMHPASAQRKRNTPRSFRPPVAVERSGCNDAVGKVLR